MLFRKKVYEIAVICSNCDRHSLIKVPRGTIIAEHLEKKLGLCPNCGCPISLEYQQQMENEGRLKNV